MGGIRTKLLEICIQKLRGDTKENNISTRIDWSK